MTGNSFTVDSETISHSLRDLCSWLYDILDRGDMYQDGDSLVECALRGGLALTLVEMALELRLNRRTRQSIAELKQDWPSRGSEQWVLCFVPAAFKLFRCMLVLAKPMKLAAAVPSTGVVTTLTKEERLYSIGNYHWPTGLPLHKSGSAKK